MQPRFSGFDVPPTGNANFVFVLQALEWIDEKAALLLPCGVLNSNLREEKAIRCTLVEKNLLESVILLPDRMFESTGISTCILVLNKRKQTCHIEMIDMRQEYAEEQRMQNGQFGGASHERRTYVKTVKVLTEQAMNRAADAAARMLNEAGYCKSVAASDVRSANYNLSPSVFLEIPETETLHRPYADIAADYNRIISMKNALKLTVNCCLAKSLGLDSIYEMMKNSPDVSAGFEAVGQKVEKECFLQISKNAAEFKIENKSKERLPEILLIFIQTWKQHIMYLNNEENRILAEFRDAILPDIMSGKISV
jgi:hypothetical protein